MASQAVSRRTRTSSKDLVPTVLQAATELLRSEGVQAVTVRAVAAQAHVAPTSLYNHFGDKQGLLDAIAEERFVIMARALRDITEKDPGDRMRRAGTIVRELMLTDPQAYELMWVTRPGPAARDAFNELIHIVQYGQVAGVFVEDDPQRLAGAIWAAVQGAVFIEWQHHSHARGSSEYVTAADDDAYEALLDMVLRGVRRG